MQLNLTQRNLVITASGKPDELRHDYAAETVGLNLGKFVLDGTEVPGTDVLAELDIHDITGTSIRALRTDRNYTQNLSIGRMSYQGSMSIPSAAETQYNFSGQTKIERLRCWVGGQWQKHVCRRFCEAKRNWKWQRVHH